MGLYFHNATGSTIDLAYAAHSSGCASEGGQPYLKKGWYVISAGETQKVWSGYAGPERFYYYAESATARWSGPYRSQVHPTNSFQWCWSLGSTDRSHHQPLVDPKEKGSIPHQQQMIEQSDTRPRGCRLRRPLAP